MVTMTHKKATSATKIALYEPDIPQNTAAIKRVVMDYMDNNKIKIYKSMSEFFSAKKNERVILMTTKAKKSYTDFNFRKNDTILFGRESAGVPERVHKLVKNKLKIPMIEKKRSLNLATSVAIVLSESIRQIKLK